MYSYGPLHMAVQKQDDQHEHTFSSCVRIRDAVLRTCLGRWTIGRCGKRGSGISVLPARHDIYIYVYVVHTISFQTFFLWALLLIVHTWNSCPLRINLLRLQCTCCIVPTISGRPHGSPLVWACQWLSSQPLSWRREADELSWCQS